MTMSHAPFLSVVIPAYNAGKTIRRCVSSIGKALAGIDHEVIAVDDCSADDTLAKLDGLAENHARLRVMRHPENRGAGPARNTGLDAAAGEYVWFVDADDELTPARNFSGLDPVSACGGCDVLFFRYKRLDYASGRMRPWVDYDRIVFAARPGDSFSRRDFSAVIATTHALWNKWFRLEAVKAAGMYFPEGVNQDFPFNAANLYAAREMRFLDRILYIYREDASVISRMTDKRRLNALGMCEMADDWLRRAGADDEFMASYYVARLHFMMLVYRSTEPEVREKMRREIDDFLLSLGGKMFLRLTRHPFLLDDVKARLYQLRRVDPGVADKARKVVSAAGGWFNRLFAGKGGK